MSHKGVVDYEQPTQSNQTFYRRPAQAGYKLSALESTILQQFPNDGYAVRAALAKKLRRYTGKITHACNFEFNSKAGLATAKIHFLDEYTASYCLSADALSRNSDNNGALIMYQLVEALNIPEASQQYQRKILGAKAPVAIA